MRYFEDFEPGQELPLEPYTVSRAEIVAFAAEFDPQPFHLDEEAAARSHFKRLCASGWHTVCIRMRLMIDSRRREDDERRARGEPVAVLGPSPGFRDLKWLKPVYAGDTITYQADVIETRALSGWPQWGLVTSLNTAKNQHGELVMSFVSAAFVERRSPEVPE